MARGLELHDLFEAADKHQALKQLSGAPLAARTRELLERARPVLVVAALAAALYLPHVLEPNWSYLAGYGLIVSLVVLSLVVITGLSGQVSLAQAGFMAVGGFGGQIFIARYGWGIYPTVFGVAVLGAAAAAVVSIPALRVRGIFLAVVTWSFGLVVDRVLLRWEWFISPRGEGSFGSLTSTTIPRPEVFGAEMLLDRRFVYFLLSFALVGLFLVRNLARNPAGIALRTQRDAEHAAYASGLAVWRLRLVAFMIGGAMASVAGYLLPMLQTSATAIDYSQFVSLNVMLMLVFAGVESYVAAVLVGVFFGIAPELHETVGLHGDWVWVIIGLAGLRLLSKKYGAQHTKRRLPRPSFLARRNEPPPALEGG